MNMEYRQIHVVSLRVRGMSGFKGEQTFQFEGENAIEGENFQNKTSIGEMIAYGFTGMDRESKAGKEKDLLNDESKEGELALEFEIVGPDGAIDRHTITRQIARTAKSVTGAVYLDGAKTSQDKLDALIGDRRHVQAAYMPQYFLQLEPADARKVLMNRIKQPKDADIREKIGEYSSDLIGPNPILDPDHYMKNRKDELKEAVNEAKKLEGAAEEAQLALAQEITPGIDEAPLMQRVDKLREAIERVKAGKPEGTSTDSLNEKRRELRSEYDAIQKGLKFDEHKIDCPHCGGEIDLTADQTAENERITARMKELVEQGKTLQASVNEIEQANQEAAAAFEAENAETLRMLQEQLNESVNELNDAKQQNMRRKLQLEARDRAAARQQEIENDRGVYARDIERLEGQINACKEYNIAKCELQIESVKSQLTDVSITLFTITKSTGEIKPTFRCSYKGREYRRLSTSEAIRAGLEIARLFRFLTATKYPVFIDYMESITHYDQPDTQTITARVVEGKALTFNGQEVGQHVA